MATKEWIDVVDTAVKIGLGSLITGVFTYLGVKFSHKSEQAKFAFEHKIKIFETISSDTEEYFTAWSGLISKVGGITKQMKHDIEPVELTKNQLKWIKERDNILVEAWQYKRSVTSKLKLLKATSAETKFKTCTDLETDLRNKMFFDKNHPNYIEHSKYRDAAAVARREFQEELANTYAEVSA
ncbi:MAG: hypothetical protein MJK12_03825 [Colwellia sp.]|nr:hypothetical protein [Colwellia sp.]